MKVAYDPDQELSDRCFRAAERPSALARLATAAGVLIGKSAVGFVGLAVVVGSMVPRPDAEGRIFHSGEIAACTVTLGLPEGHAAGRLAVVDEAGRELAVLTRRSDGELALMARSGAVGIGCWFNQAAGTAFVNLIGKGRETRFELLPDGTPKALAGGSTGPGNRPDEPGGRGTSPRARTAMIHHALDGLPFQLALDPRS
jgi:hypothetical protein